MTAMWLVFGSSYPYFQIQALLVMTLVTMWYIGATAPFKEMKQNFNETFNEMCVVLCIYVVMLFMMSSDVKFLETMTMVFIGIVALNILGFGGQAVPEIIQDLKDRYNNKQTQKGIAKEVQLMIDNMDKPNQDMVLMPWHVVSWEKNLSWTPQREWIIKNELDLESFKEETEFQELKAKYIKVSEANWIAQKGTKII